MSLRSRLPLAVAILLAACSTDTPVAPAQTHGPAYAVAAVPFRASCEMVIEPPTPVSPGVIRQVDSGECNATHLGQARILSDKVINTAAGTQTTEITFTAANGDVLHGSGSGTSGMIAPGRVAFTATITFTGGTGRFEDATGQATITGEADLAAGRSRMAAEGSIRY